MFCFDVWDIFWLAIGLVLSRRPGNPGCMEQSRRFSIYIKSIVQGQNGDSSQQLNEPPHNGRQNSTLYENCPMVSNAAGIIILSSTKGKARFSFRFPPCRYSVTICGFPNLHSLSVLGVCPPAMICLAVMWSLTVHPTTSLGWNLTKPFKDIFRSYFQTQYFA